MENIYRPTNLISLLGFVDLYTINGLNLKYYKYHSKEDMQKLRKYILELEYQLKQKEENKSIVVDVKSPPPGIIYYMDYSYLKESLRGAEESIDAWKKKYEELEKENKELEEENKVVSEFTQSLLDTVEEVRKLVDKVI